MNGDVLQKSYVWGLDLSQTQQGAGGVGGLLSMTTASNGERFYYAYDANGNVSELVDGAGVTQAHYEYTPFGGTVLASGGSLGTSGEENSFRFSTKYFDPETNLSYYGYRHYNAETARWLSRDPIEERGGLNLCAFVGNDGVNWFDVLGMIDGIHESIQSMRERGEFGSGSNNPQDFYDPIQGVKEFVDNYLDMREANTIGADKYFHCMANCNAAKKGAAQTSKVISDVREWVDENIKGDPKDACEADQRANEDGRDVEDGQSCKDRCSKYRTNGLDPKY